MAKHECNHTHSIGSVCEDNFCYILRGEPYHTTVLFAFKDLQEDWRTDPMLLAQTLNSKYRVDVSEAQLILNLPPLLAYRVNKAGEGIIFQYLI